MHRNHAVDGDGVASTQFGGGVHRHGLEAVVHVGRLASSGHAGGHRHPVVAGSGLGVNRGICTTGCADAVGVVELVGLETSHSADEAATICLVADLVAERARRHSQIAGHAVVVAARQRQVAVEHLHALLVHDRVARSHVVVAAGRGRGADHQRTQVRGDVHDGEVDVRGQLLLGGVAEAAFLQSVAQLQRVHDPRHRLLEAERGRNGQLRELGEVQRLVHAVVGLRDVGLRAPDHVVGALHHRAVGTVHGDVARQHKRVVEAFEDVLERYALFLGKTVCHLWLLRIDE